MRKWLMLDGKWLAAHAKAQPPRGKFQFRAFVPRKHPAPVLLADKPWEAMSLGWNTLLQDGGRYRLWYEAWDETYKNDYDGRLCYAESDDLIAWRKPELGLVEFRGSKRNNIVFNASKGFDLGFHGHSVCIDPTAPHDARYRMIYTGYDGKDCHILTAQSPDGIGWSVSQRPSLSYESDTQTVAFWDASLQKYVGYFRTWEKGCRVNPSARLRCIGRAETDDFDHWPRPATVRTPDEADGPDTDLYNNAACRYESGGDVAYLIFTSTFNHRSDQCEVELATSRDGMNWQRFSRTKIIPCGSTAWDAGMVFASPTLVPFRDGVALSYSGHAQKHSETQPDKVRYAGGIGFAEYPADRFQGLWTEDLEATLCSFTLGPIPPRVALNLAVQPGGGVRGAILQAGKPIAGYGFDDCAAVVGDATAAELMWKGASQSPALAGQRVELRLRLRSACLYAVAAENVS
jgi:hypothetical protein